MSEPERIYLDPVLAEQVGKKTGKRQTAEYVRADLYERLEAKVDRLERALRRECRCRPVVTQTIGGHDVGRPKCRACLALEEGREP